MSAAAIDVFGRYARELHRYLMKRWRRPQDIDDLAQEVFLRLLKTDPSTVEKPLPFLYGVASHVLADHIFDTKHTHIDWSADADEWMESPSQVLPDDLAERLNLQQQIDKALAKLPATQRAVIVLHKGDGLSYEEVAERLGLSIHTVEKYVTFGKAQLRMMQWER